MNANRLQMHTERTALYKSRDAETVPAGTYARERGGAGHVFYSPHRWRDPSHALAQWRDQWTDAHHRGTVRGTDWQIVYGAALDTFWNQYGPLMHGEYVEVAQ